MRDNDSRWVGPFQLRSYLERCLDDERPWPPESNGVYVVSEHCWQGYPRPEAGVLYIGSNTSQSALFLVRIGSLVADMLGFFTDDYGHHSGGASLWIHCKKVGLHPLDLHLGWVEGISCCRCAEIQVYKRLVPPKHLCKKVPARCNDHIVAPNMCLFGE